MKRFLNDKRNRLSIITTALAVVAVLISFIFKEFSYQIIAVMFVVISGNFIVLIMHIEDIKQAGEIPSSSTIPLETWEDSDADVRDKIMKAKKELFIIGMTMNSWGSLGNKIKDKAKLHSSSGVKVKVLFANPNNDELLDMYTKMRGGAEFSGDKTTIEYFVNGLKGERNIEMKVVNKIMPIVYFAADKDETNGYIRVIPLLSTTSNDDIPTIALTPTSGKSYDVYRGQIEELWKSGNPLES
ncbi:MAG: hypothetical protein FWC20_08930 [Oscillospiraceae bacterium]|nr:hypothetical protein [Oscillospiraceae bacterium]MCL2279513.1 hypothetical protein [Oscillospiraceae bacterium]